MVLLCLVIEKLKYINLKKPSTLFFFFSISFYLFYRENDLDEIAKEAGIDINQSEELPDIPQQTKKEKKKKKGRAEQNNDGDEV